VTLVTPAASFVLDIAGAASDTFIVVSGTSGTLLETTTAAAIGQSPKMQMIAPAHEDTSMVGTVSFGAVAVMPEGWSWQAMADGSGSAIARPETFTISAGSGAAVLIPGAVAIPAIGMTTEAKG